MMESCWPKVLLMASFRCRKNTQNDRTVISTVWAYVKSPVDIIFICAISEALLVAACNRKQPCSQSAQFSAQINCD
ncbi:hypothetical protein PCPL58_p4088 (plasmid) [Pseudomonas cerasi]|nr:hypothetical protein PCPL58_p4015 [Pseudomonas cerasi]CZT26349.1 hypothetical protein PCPL58_p4088 [Pseudomonas cerasi]